MMTNHIGDFSEFGFLLWLIWEQLKGFNQDTGNNKATFKTGCKV